MARVLTPNGARIKALRKARETGDTQKELAHQAGLGVRTLRLIENENHPMDVRRLRRLAAALGVPHELIVFAEHGPRLVDAKGPVYAPKEKADTHPVTFPEIPRFSEVVLRRVDGVKELQEIAGMAEVIVSHFMAEMDIEVNGYVEEMLVLLKRMSIFDDGREPDRFDGLDFPELGRLRRLRELLILLKGNDVLVHVDINYRSYLEGEERPIPDLPFQSQLIIACAPPGDGDCVSVTVDHSRSVPARPLPSPSSGSKGEPG